MDFGGQLVWSLGFVLFLWVTPAVLRGSSRLSSQESLGEPYEIPDGPYIRQIPTCCAVAPARAFSLFGLFRDLLSTLQ